MQPLWYGDRRDRVKWGALIHLAQKHQIHDIFWVVYYSDPIKRTLNFDDVPEKIPDVVWAHFSDMKQIERLGEPLGIRISVLDCEFSHESRTAYRYEILQRIATSTRPKIVFLDPDTGIAPTKAKGEHVTFDDIKEVWLKLGSEDIIAVYQHARHTKKWKEDCKTKLGALCSGAAVHVVTSDSIAGDVAILWAEKPSAKAAASPPE